jgi:hypothetical protein
MPQHLGDHLWVHVLGEQERGARVPEVVEAYLRQACPLEQGLEAAGSDVLAGERRAALRGEDETILAPQTARLVYLLQLTLQVASEGFQGSLRESHGAAAALGLRRGKDRAALRGGKGAPHLQSPDLKVNVIPLEPQ